MRAKPFLEFVLLGNCSPITVPLCIFEEVCAGEFPLGGALFP